MQRRFRQSGFVRVLGLSLLVIAIALAQREPPPKGLTLRGQVVDGLTGRPLTGVEIALNDGNWQSAAEPIAVDAEGRFAFTGLTASEYLLSATRPDFGTVLFHELPDPGLFQTIHFKPQETVKTILFRVMPRGTLTGIVRDELSDPMEGIRVVAQRAVWSDGHISLQASEQAVTDDRGRYRIGNLPPAGYIVCAAPGHEMTQGMLGFAPANGRAIAPTAGTVDFASRAEPRYYFQTCTPDLTPSSLVPVAVVPGRSAAADVTLRASSAVSVRGRLLHLPAGVGTAVNLTPENAVTTGQPMASGVEPDGSFTIQGVLPGRYRLDANVTWQPPNSPPVALVGRLVIEVGGANIDGVEVPLQAPSVVEVVLHGAAKKDSESDALQLGLRPADSSAGSTPADRDAKGPLHIASLVAGAYWLVTRTSDSTCVLSAKLGEQDALKAPLTIQSGVTAQLDVTVSKECGQIQARVISEGETVPDAKVVLLISGSAKDPGNMLTDFADEEGNVSFAGLAPGRYTLWAWRVDPAGSFVGPATLQSVEAQATSVSITKGEPMKVDIPLLHKENVR